MDSSFFSHQCFPKLLAIVCLKWVFKSYLGALKLKSLKDGTAVLMNFKERVKSLISSLLQYQFKSTVNFWGFGIALTLLEEITSLEDSTAGHPWLSMSEQTCGMKSERCYIALRQFFLFFLKGRQWKKVRILIPPLVRLIGWWGKYI